jgi:hypothetical protein
MEYALYENAITVLKKQIRFWSKSWKIVRENGRCHTVLSFRHLENMEVTEISDGNLDNLQLKLKEFTTVLGTINLTLLLNYEFTSEELSRLAFCQKTINNSRCFVAVFFCCPLLIESEGSYQNSDISSFCQLILVHRKVCQLLLLQISFPILAFPLKS